MVNNETAADSVDESLETPEIEVEDSCETPEADNSCETENTEVQTEATKEVETTSVTRVRIKRDVFMRVWEETVAGLEDGELEGSGVKIVAEKLGLNINTVQQRSTKYRKSLGLPLSNMPRGGGARFNVDVAKDELAAIKETIEKARLERAAKTTEVVTD